MVTQTCYECGYNWRPRGRDYSVRCPNCGVKFDEIHRGGSAPNAKSGGCLKYLLVIVLAPIVICCGFGGLSTLLFSPSRDTAMAPPDQAASSTPAPEDTTATANDAALITYKILSEESRLTFKQAFNVEVPFIDGRLPTKPELAAISNHLKASRSKKDRTFVLFYLPGEDPNGLAFATAHHTPDLEVAIVREPSPPEELAKEKAGLTLEKRKQYYEELLLTEMRVDAALRLEVSSKDLRAIQTGVDESKQELRERYNLTAEQSAAIVAEAYNNQWPTPEDNLTLADILPREAEPKPASDAETVASANTDDLHSMRTWSDLTGKFTVEAAFVSYTAGKLKIRRKDGRIVELQLDQLSKTDQEWIYDKLRKKLHSP